MADSNSLAVGWEWLAYWFIIWKVHPSLSFCLKRNVQNTFVYKSKFPDPQILRHKHRRLINQVCSFNNIKVPSGPVLGEATASALQNIIGWFQNTTKKTHDKFYPFPWIWFKRNVIADAHWCTQSSDRGVIFIPGSKVFFFFAWVEIKPGLKNWGPKLSRRQQILSCLCSNFGSPQPQQFSTLARTKFHINSSVWKRQVAQHSQIDGQIQQIITSVTLWRRHVLLDINPRNCWQRGVSGFAQSAPDKRYHYSTSIETVLFPNLSVLCMNISVMLFPPICLVQTTTCSFVVYNSNN